MADLGAPVRVSPIIKFGRWSALLLGIAWGAHRYNVHAKEEASFREEEARRKAVRDAAAAEEKKRLNRQEMIYLAESAGVKVPENF